MKSERSSGEQCFLCGETLTPRTRSKEHFLPRWFPRAATGTLRISMANQSVSQPRHLIVPCCTECNGAFSTVENHLAEALRDGPEAARMLDRRAVAAWAAKVIWGFAVLEARLPRERTQPNGPRMLTSGQIDMLRPLQEIARDWLRGAGDRPGSLHAFHAQHEPEDDIGFLDDPPAGLVTLWLGHTVIVVSATDHRDAEHLSRGELTALGYLPVFTDLGDLPLGPIQFREIVAWASTLHGSRPPMPLPGAPFGAFDWALYRERLDATVGQLPAFRVTGVPWCTTLFNEDMSPRFVSMGWTREMGNRIVGDTRK